MNYHRRGVDEHQHKCVHEPFREALPRNIMLAIRKCAKKMFPELHVDSHPPVELEIRGDRTSISCFNCKDIRRKRIVAQDYPHYLFVHLAKKT